MIWYNNETILKQGVHAIIIHFYNRIWLYLIIHISIVRVVYL